MGQNEDALTCICCIIIIVVAGLYLVWSEYGSLPFVIGGLVLGGLIIIFIRNSRKAKQVEQETQSLQTAKAIDARMSEEKFEQQQNSKGLHKYVNKKGEIMWGSPDQVAEWARLDRASVEVVIKKEVVKIRCPYCGSLYDEHLNRCPHCNGNR